MSTENEKTASTQTRIVQAFVGEYASGKSENAVNAALHLREQGRQVSIIDLDLVEPFYTLRPIKDELIRLGLEVVAWKTEETFGLGEAGSTIIPAARWALRRSGDVIIDVGYGVYGSRSLRLLEGVDESTELQVILVLNTARPMTGNADLIEEYLDEIGRVDAIVANTHMMSETTPELVESGYRLIRSVADRRQVPVLYAAVSEEFAGQYPDFQILDAGKPIEIRIIKRFMPKSFW